jgi:hypothetical protein
MKNLPRPLLTLASIAVMAWVPVDAVAREAAAAPPTYRVEVVGAGLQGFDMNASGVVVGRQLNAQQVGKAFAARRGEAPQLLPTPAEWQSSDAYAISPNGIIVGAVSTATIASIGSRAAAWHPTKAGYQFTLLTPYPGDTHSTATAVNSHGDIVGGSGGLGLGSYPRAVRFREGPAEILPQISLPADINEGRVVLAWNQLLDLDDMSVTTIPLPPGNWQGFVGIDLTDNGNFCGYVLGFSGCSTFPLRYRPGFGWEFVGGCATTTAANSINSRGDVTAYVASISSWVAFVGETNSDPASLIDPRDGVWTILGVGSINDNRAMLASGRPLGDPVTKLLRLVPVLAEDLNDDGAVGPADLAILLSAWGSKGGDADLDGDGAVGAADLARLLTAWG